VIIIKKSIVAQVELAIDTDDHDEAEANAKHMLEHPDFTFDADMPDGHPHDAWITEWVIA
jgi:hypothetical protein